MKARLVRSLSRDERRRLADALHRCHMLSGPGGRVCERVFAEFCRVRARPVVIVRRGPRWSDVLLSVEPMGLELAGEVEALVREWVQAAGPEGPVRMARRGGPAVAALP